MSTGMKYTKLNVVRCSLSDVKLKLKNIHQEKGASIWLSTLPLKDYLPNAFV